MTDHGLDALGIILVINKPEVYALAISVIHIDLKVYLLIASGGVHELSVLGSGPPGESVGDVVHESSIHRIEGPRG